MKEYSNISDVTEESIKPIIPDLAALLYELFCNKQQSEKEKTAQKKRFAGRYEPPEWQPPLIHFEILMKSDRAVPMCLRTTKGTKI